MVLKQHTAEDNWKHMDKKTMNNARNVTATLQSVIFRFLFLPTVIQTSRGDDSCDRRVCRVLFSLRRSHRLSPDEARVTSRRFSSCPRQHFPPRCSPRAMTLSPRLFVSPRNLNIFTRIVRSHAEICCVVLLRALSIFSRRLRRGDKIRRNGIPFYWKLRKLPGTQC